MRKVLVTNHFLKDFTGSEIATLDLTKEFLSRGYDVTVGSFTFADPLKSKFDLLDVKMIDLSSAKAEHFDLIWAHHFTTLDTCLIDIGITADKIIFSSLSPYEALESPPLSIDKVDLVLANSHETRGTLIEMGIESSSIEIFPNPVSDAFFIDLTKDQFSLKKLAIVSNHIPAEIKDTVTLLGNHGIEVKIFGIEGEFKLITPDILKEFDAVITIGRTVQYCLAMGIPVYCYDRFGGPGWITSKNIENVAKHNFSGRCTNRQLSSDEIATEIIKSFSAIQSKIDFYHQFALENYSLSRLIDVIMTKISNPIKNIHHHKKDLYINIVKRQRIYLANVSNIDIFAQLFLDHGNGIYEENSIKLPVFQNNTRQEVDFNFSHQEKLVHIEFSPVNQSCVIEIDRIYLSSENQEIDLTQQILSNATISAHPFYFFDTNTPTLFFNNLNISNAKSFKINLTFHALGYKNVSKSIIDWQKNKIETIEKSKLWKILKIIRRFKQIPKILFIYLKFFIKKLYVNTLLFFDTGKNYNDKFFHNQKNHEKSNNRLVVFSHYDKNNIIDDYVLYYLSEIKKMGADIIFVSTAEKLNDHELQKISHLCKRSVVKQNIGYDFGAWRAGIGLASEILDQYEQLILCNDSVYAPLFGLDKMFNAMQDKYDFWGLTDNYQHGHHIQSYFMVFTKQVFLQDYFLDFWKNIRVFKHKESIIRHYEIGLTKLLRKHNINYVAYCPSDYQSKMNTTHYEWKKLILDQKCPIIKIELLRDNPTKTDISDWEEVISKTTNYDVSLIKNHLQRIKH